MIFKKQPLEVTHPEYIEINNEQYEIEVKFFKKRSSSVIVKSKKLEFRLSNYLSSKQAQKHFEDLFKKIVYKVSKTNQTHEKTIEEVLEKGQFEFSSQTYYLEYTKNRGVKLKENTFFINMHTRKELIRKHIINLLLKKYAPRIEEYIKEVNRQTFNFEIKSTSLKMVESKWGHCTAQNDIMINLKLLNGTKEQLDYVIIHELAHVKHKNHSENFWKEVARFYPNHKNMRKTLKLEPPRLFQ